MVDSNHSISDLIEQPDDLSPIKITKTVSNVSLVQRDPDSMPDVETVSEPQSSAPTKDVEVEPSVERLDVSQEPPAAMVEQVESLQSLLDCTVEDVREDEVPEELLDASIDMVVKAFQSAGKKISEGIVSGVEPVEPVHDGGEDEGEDEGNDYDEAIYSSSSTHLCAHLSEKILETSQGSIKESTLAESNPELIDANSTPAPADTVSAADVDPSTTTLQALFHKDSVATGSVASRSTIIPGNASACEAGYYTTGDKPGAPDIINVMSYQTDVGVKSVQFSTTKVEHDHPVKSPRPPIDSRTPEKKKADRKALEEKTAAFGVKVQNNLNDSLVILEKDFVHGRGGSSNGSDSIRDMGNHILENDIKESKKTSQGSMKSSSSYFDNHTAPTDKQLHAEIVRLEEVVEESKQEISIYQRELERVRASGDDILELCNELSIDPAIATVQNLLHMMQQVRVDMAETQHQNNTLTNKLKEQTTLLAEQSSLINELDSKLKAQDQDDDHRVEDKCDEIFEYYEVKLEGIQEQLAKMNVELHSDFWVPHAHTLTARLTEIRSHKRTVAEQSLRRNISDTETDKYDSNENLENTKSSASRGIFTQSEKTIITANQLGNHSKYKVENDMPRNKNAKNNDSRSCSIQ